MGFDPTTAVTFGVAGAAIAAFAMGVQAQRQMRRDYAAAEDFRKAEDERDKRCDACDRRIGDCVTKEILRMQLEPIEKEQEHRARSMETLGRAVVRTDRRSQRIEIAVAAIAAKLGIPASHEPDPDTE